MIRALAFDFDGVLVETVEVKTGAFARLFAAEPPEAVARIVEHHRRNGGVSRFEKFRTIYRDILQRPLTEEEFERLCDRFATLVVDEVVAAPWTEGAQEFVAKYRGRYPLFIVSGTPEEELKTIVRRRGIESWFDGVFGAPATKDAILRDILRRHHLQPAEMVFVGDAQTDWTAARQTGVPFVWRKVPGETTGLQRFTGPRIPSLGRLAECLKLRAVQTSGVR